MSVVSGENFSDFLSHSDRSRGVEEHLGRLVELGHCQLGVEHDNTLVHAVKLGTKEVVVREYTLQVFYVEQD